MINLKCLVGKVWMENSITCYLYEVFFMLISDQEFQLMFDHYFRKIK